MTISGVVEKLKKLGGRETQEKTDDPNIVLQLKGYTIEFLTGSDCCVVVLDKDDMSVKLAIRDAGIGTIDETVFEEIPTDIPIEVEQLYSELVRDLKNLEVINVPEFKF